MALTIIIILTFVFPAAMAVLLVLVYKHLKREQVQERAENEKLIKAFEKLDATKTKIIDKLSRAMKIDL